MLFKLKTQNVNIEKIDIFFDCYAKEMVGFSEKSFKNKSINEVEKIISEKLIESGKTVSFYQKEFFIKNTLLNENFTPDSIYFFFYHNPQKVIFVGLFVREDGGMFLRSKRLFQDVLEWNRFKIK